MIKGAISAALGLFALCLPVSAQQPLGPQQRLFETASLDYSSRYSPWNSLENNDRFFFSTAFGSMRPSENYLPAFDPSEVRNYDARARGDSKDSLDSVVDLRRPERFTYGGEIGFLYGKSTGKYGREDFSAYILGTVGNDKFQITAGYLRQETTVNVPRRRR